MFLTNQLIGFGARRGGGLSLSYIGTTTDGTNGVSFTFSSHAIGTAAADRLVIVGILYNNNADTTASAPSSVTIGGNSATIHGSALGTAPNECGASIASLDVASGTTADIVVTFPDDAVRCGIVVYTLTGWTSTTPAANTGSTTTAGTVVDDAFTVSEVQTGIYVTCHNGTGGRTCSFTNATENVDAVLEAAQANYAAGTIAAGAGSVTVTATWSGSGDIAAYGAIWG